MRGTLVLHLGWNPIVDVSLWLVTFWHDWFSTNNMYKIYFGDVWIDTTWYKGIAKSNGEPKSKIHFDFDRFWSILIDFDRFWSYIILYYVLHNPRYYQKASCRIWIYGVITFHDQPLWYSIPMLFFWDWGGNPIF